MEFFNDSKVSNQTYGVCMYIIYVQDFIYILRIQSTKSQILSHMETNITMWGLWEVYTILIYIFQECKYFLKPLSSLPLAFWMMLSQTDKARDDSYFRDFPSTSHILHMYIVLVSLCILGRYSVSLGCILAIP